MDNKMDYEKATDRNDSQEKRKWSTPQIWEADLHDTETGEAGGADGGLS